MAAPKELDANGLAEDEPKPEEKLNPVEPLPPKEKGPELPWLGWLGAWLAPGKLWLWPNPKPFDWAGAAENPGVGADGAAGRDEKAPDGWESATPPVGVAARGRLRRSLILGNRSSSSVGRFFPMLKIRTRGNKRESMKKQRRGW